MKKLWKKIALGLIALTIASQAHALILVEPYLGYDYSLKGEYAGDVGDFNFSGFGYGLRLGLQFTTLMLGVSWDRLDLEFENGFKEDVDQTNFGVFVGWSPKGEGVRFWGEYFIDVKNDYVGPGQDSGEGFGLGLGWKFKPWLALNLEYRNWSMDDSIYEKGSSLFLNLSFPLDLL
ncbi:MAG: hypothetical protein ACHQYQ_10600 [Bacteriovoracales bacterium]